MESGANSGFPLWQKIVFAFGGLAAIALIGYLVDKPASEDDSPKKRTGRRPPVAQEYEPELDQVLPSFAKQPMNANGPPTRHKRKGEPAMRQNMSLQDLMRLADQAQRFGDYDKAEEMYTIALNQLESIGADIFSISVVTYALSLCYRAKHELHNAEEYMLRALNMIEQVMSDPPQLNQSTAATLIDQYADILATLADVYLDMERYDECEVYLMKSFQFVEKKAEVIEKAEVSGEEEENAKRMESAKLSKQIAILNDNLFKLRFKQKRFDDAIAQGKKTVELLTKAFGPAEVFTAQSMMRLAVIYQEMKQYDEANKVYDSIIISAENDPEGDFSKVAGFLQFQAHQNMRKEVLPIAEKCLLKAIDIIEKQIEKGSEDYLLKAKVDLMNSLIHVYLDMGRKDDANKLKVQMKETAEKNKINPPLSISRYLQSKSATFTYDTPDKLENLKISYNIVLEINVPRHEEKLPDTAMIVCTFENPVEGDSPLVVEQPINPGQSTISIQSSTVAKTQEKCYDVEVIIYKDVSKSEIISHHYLSVKAPMNTTELRDLEDLQTKLYEVNAQRRRA